jgi:hypothetical protein
VRHPPLRRAELTERETHTLFERGLRRGRCPCHDLPRFTLADAEAPQPGEHFVLSLLSRLALGRRALGRPPVLAALVLHEVRSERTLGFELIVRAAAQP